MEAEPIEEAMEAYHAASARVTNGLSRFKEASQLLRESASSGGGGGGVEGEASPAQLAEVQQQVAAQLERDCQVCSESLKTMQAELRHASHRVKSTYTPSIRRFQKEASSFRKEVQQCRRTADHNALLQAGTSYRPTTQSGRQFRSRVLETREMQSKTSEAIEFTHRGLVESTSVGRDVVANLRRQREGLLRSKEVFSETQSLGIRAQGILRAMVRRTVTNKLITAFIIFLELLIIGVIVWYKWFRDVQGVQ